MVSFPTYFLHCLRAIYMQTNAQITRNLICNYVPLHISSTKENVNFNLWLEWIKMQLKIAVN